MNSEIHIDQNLNLPPKHGLRAQTQSGRGLERAAGSLQPPKIETPPPNPSGRGLERAAGSLQPPKIETPPPNQSGRGLERAASPFQPPKIKTPFTYENFGHHECIKEENFKMMNTDWAISA